jgi:hypothetical protein
LAQKGDPESRGCIENSNDENILISTTEEETR